MFVSVCLATFGVAGYLVTTSTMDVLEREVLGRLEFQSRAYATALDGYLQMLTRRGEDFASDGFIRDHFEAILSGEGNGERLRGELRAHLLENKLPLVPAFLDLTLVTVEGDVIVAARSAPPPGFAEALAGGSPGDGPRFSGLLPAVEDEGYPRLAISAPVHSRDRDELLGEIVVWVHPAVWIVDALRSSGIGVVEDRATLQLVDDKGWSLHVRNELTAADGPLADSELVRSGFGLELAATEPAGAAASKARNSSDVFSRSFPIAANGWSVRIDLRGDSVHSAVAKLQSRLVGLGILVTLAASALFIFPMRFLTRPLLNLAAAARRLAGGDASARVRVDTDDEFGELAGAFNSMAEAVEERTSRLEHTATDLRERQNELGFERDRLKAVISSMRDGLVVLDADGELVVHNRAAGPILTQLRDGNGTMRAYHRCDESEDRSAACHACLFSPEVGSSSCVVEIEGGVFEIHAERLAPDARGRSGRVLVSRDVSDRIARDERESHQDRLAVLGEVAAVMAHELNNPLAAISMYNQMLAAELRELPDLAENVDVIQRNVETCKRTIRELLNYATNATPELDTVELNATLEDASAFLRPLRERSNVALELNLWPQPLFVRGDEIQIRQVFVNLLVNAIQAVDAGNGAVSVTTLEEDGHAIVLVSDDGPGVPVEVREKIFRPFFTTKDRGEGTGLGLPTARRIAEMYGGGLELTNGKTTGSTFRVRFRLLQEDPA